MDNKQTGNLLLGPENGDDVADDRTKGEATYEDNHGLQVHDASSATVRNLKLGREDCSQFFLSECHRVWGQSECQQCTGCHRLPPLLHPQPLCCHLLTRGRLSRAFLLVGWICCAVPRPMRSVVRAAGGECGSRATSEQQRQGWRLSPPGGETAFPEHGESTLPRLPSIPPA